MKCPNCNFELGKKKKRFCLRGIPKTYAENYIPRYIKLVNGINTKGEFDKSIFDKRIKEFTNMKIGSEITIKKNRENGRHGQEEREVLNFLVCSGLYVKKQQEIGEDNNEIKYIETFIRKDDVTCELFNVDKITKRKYSSCLLPKEKFKIKFYKNE